MNIWTKAFWAATVERAVKTLAQTALAVIVTAGVSSVLDVDWVQVASASALAAVISILTSITSNAVTKTGPSFTDSEQVVPTTPAKDEAGQPGAVPAPSAAVQIPSAAAPTAGTATRTTTTAVPPKETVAQPAGTAGPVDANGDGRDDRTGRFVRRS